MAALRTQAGIWRCDLLAQLGRVRVLLVGPAWAQPFRCKFPSYPAGAEPATIPRPQGLVHGDRPILHLKGHSRRAARPPQ